MFQKRNLIIVSALCLTFLFSIGPGMTVHAENPAFDASYYAAVYPDVTAALGTNPQTLLEHYLNYGIKEGRLPYAGAAPGAAVNALAANNTTPDTAASGLTANSTTPDAAANGHAPDFDPVFYAAAYPDVAAACGTDPQALLNHYLKYGKKEGRLSHAVSVETPAPAAIETQSPTKKETGFQPVAIDKLANLSSLKQKQTDEEFALAYHAALAIVTPYAGLSREEQLKGISTSLRKLFDSNMTYSMTASHYNDPYGYLILHSASCAGCARATGLCLNILEIPYEHVNENQYTHQWCRVNVNGTYWICDAYGLTCGPEPAPYAHPYL